MRSWCWSVSFWISVAAKVQACSTSTQVTACVAGGFVVERCKWAVRIMGQHCSFFWLWCSFLWLCCLFYIPLWQNYQLRWLLKWYWQIFIFHCCSTPYLWKGAAWYFPVKLITNRWELGCWCLQSWGSQAMLKHKEGGIHGNPTSGTPQALSHWTVQWNTYEPVLTWPWTKESGRVGKKKNSTKMSSKQQESSEDTAQNYKEARCPC